MGGTTASIQVAPSELSGALCALRLCPHEAQEAMRRSLSTLGQLTPVLAWRTGASDSLQIFDGLKRWRAAQDLSWPTLRVEVHTLDGAGAKVRLLKCNAAAGLSDLEEAWVIRSLYRDDKLTQGKIATLLDHPDKSWVCRRLALAEGLCDELTAKVRLGLVSTTACRELVRLPRGNQDAVAEVVTRRGLTTRQTARLVDELLASPQQEWPKLLEQTFAPAAPPGPAGGAKRRTPGEQLVADAWAMKRLAARLHARLLERSLQSLGAPACETVSRELCELRSTLAALTRTLDKRLGAQGASDATV